MKKYKDYREELRLIKSLMIVTSLQKKEDLNARKIIENFTQNLNWEPLNQFMIDEVIWHYIVQEKNYEPRFVFCHPDLLIHNPKVSLYYRGLCGLSKKAAINYFGAIENLEKGNPRARLDVKKATHIARVYNTFICSIIKNSTKWTLENGYRTIIATMAISLDGSIRNKVGAIAEERVKTLFINFVLENGLLIEPDVDTVETNEEIPTRILLRDNIRMIFSSEPDISFYRDDELIAVIEIKGGIDPAGALERYGAATKSFQHAIEMSRRCRNFYLAAIITDELERRIKEDRLVEGYFDIIRLLENPEYRSQFFKEIFHHTLRII